MDKAPYSHPTRVHAIFQFFWPKGLNTSHPKFSGDPLGLRRPFFTNYLTRSLAAELRRLRSAVLIITFQ
jgi:hypothetical protein